MQDCGGEIHQGLREMRWLHGSRTSIAAFLPVSFSLHLGGKDAQPSGSLSGKMRLKKHPPWLLIVGSQDVDVGKPWSDGLQNHGAFGLGLELVMSSFTGCTGGLKKERVGAHRVLSGQPEAGFAGRVLCGEMEVGLQVGPALCC